ncbi:hypothetical protein Cgig2_032508 [Carnegiea gigantea]|uniref:glucan endo-1,3-beta-D-glucosidase n=1 Tax=Carnegiea gigantea TaxID=171969 RepID=A0A9Q1QPX3_9CARY|nr:hypothetical protein Cgig2_032508 [Carnegiea gigantea]
MCLSLSFIFSLLLSSLLSSDAQSFLGVNYGQVADNLPPPESTVKLLKSTAISKVRLYGSDPVIIKALANTGIGIAIGAANGDIPALASDPGHASDWVGSNVLAYYPGSKIVLINVGNEVLFSGDQNLISQLVPAMQNVQNALNAAQLGGKIKVSTVNAMSVLSQSDPPSSGAFNPANGDTMKQLLEFLKQTGSPFTINPYPFFAYQSDPRPDTLAFCLFQPNAGRVDSGTNIKYMNMFDAQVDAVHSALNAMGYKDVDIVVAETGWPYKGDSNEVGPSIENAKAYNGGLISHLRSGVGTPLMPGKSIDTYIFALYDEDLKPGPTSERSFGLFKPDLSMAYDAGLSKSSQATVASPPAPSPSAGIPLVTPAPSMVPVIPAPSTTPVDPAPVDPAPVNPAPTTAPGSLCGPKQGVLGSQQLQGNTDNCTQGISCSLTGPNGPCVEPSAVASSHTSYARNPWNSDFVKTTTVSVRDPCKLIYHKYRANGHAHFRLIRSDMI